MYNLPRVFHGYYLEFILFFCRFTALAYTTEDGLLAVFFYEIFDALLQF